MSNKIITRVFEQSATKGGDRLLMVSIADQAGDDGIAWPGIPNICDRMGGVTERSVKLQFNRIMPRHELLIYPRARQSHSFIVAVGMSTQELKRAMRKLAKIRKVSTLELAKIRRARAGKKVFEGEKSSPRGGDPGFTQGGESAITQGVNQDSPMWITFEAEGDPRSLMIPHMNRLPAASAAGGADDSLDSDLQKRDPITQAVIIGSFNLPADAELDQHADHLLSRITNWLGTNYPADSADDVRGFYRWFADNTNGAAAPRDLPKFSMRYRECKADRDGTAPKPASTVPTMRRVEIDPGPNYTLEERAALADLMEKMRNGEAASDIRVE
jgi:hypothetical protein